MLLVAITIMGIASGAAALVTSRLTQAERETELLFRGMAYRDAIKRYYEAGATTVKTLPRSLDDLLRDPRFPDKHHIRQLYSDPLAKPGEAWTLIRAADGGIAGVSSAAPGKPIKTGHFPRGLDHLGSAQTYAEWIFQYVPPPPPAAPVAAPRLPLRPNKPRG